MNVVELGLVYGVEVRGNGVSVQLTMTSPACPLGDVIVDGATAAIRLRRPASAGSRSRWSGTHRGHPSGCPRPRAGASAGNATPMTSAAPGGFGLAVRLPLLVLGFASLVLGVGSGLARAGIGFPLPAPGLAAWHGPLMVCGFFGTVIGLERAVAIGARRAYAAPLLAGAGGLALTAAATPAAAQWLLAAASVLLAVESAAICARQRALFTFTLALGAASWAVGNAAWLAGASLARSCRGGSRSSC